ncbi:MAG: sigma-70 family RNA polymerase sigma factor [Chitinophagaceae bacterium]|nr:sigma-70 family RNA polymerase sigma factor [Chitinophagaceae bacterium]
MAAGSSLAFDTLYYRYFESVRANILRITRNETATDDILQEVFIQLWERRKQLADREKVSGWLFVVSYNRSLNHLRKISTERLKQQSPGLQIVTDWPAEEALQEMQLRLLEEAIAQLPPQRRKVFELCKFKGFTYDQAAQELSISKNTVKDHLSHASASIHNYITQQGGSSPALSILTITLLSLWQHE